MTASNRNQLPVTVDEKCELEHCKREIAQLKQLVVRLSEIVLRNLAKSADGQRSEHLEAMSDPRK